MSAPLCTIKRPGGRVCGGILRARPAKFGRLEWDCMRCDRRNAGVCADCPRPVEGTVGKADRCAACKRRALRRADRLWHARDVERSRRIELCGARRRRERLRLKRPANWKESLSEKRRAAAMVRWERHRKAVAA